MKRRDGTKQAKPFPKNRRRRKYIWPEIQIRIAFQMLCVTLPVLFFNFLLLYDGALSHDQALSGGDAAAFQAVYGIILKSFLIACAIAIPFSLCIGILSSFPFSGPIFRFNRYLTDLLNGRWDEPCRLRQTDLLHTLKDNVNGAVNLFTSRIRRQHELLEEALKIMEDPGSSFQDHEKVKLLARTISFENDEVAARLGEAETTAEGAPASTQVEEETTAAS